MPLAINGTDNQTEAPANATTGVAITLQATDIRPQNWTVVADGRGHALFPSGTLNGQSGMYAVSEGACSGALDYMPLATPLSPLTPGNYSLCQRSGAAPAQYLGSVRAIGPIAFATDPPALREGASFLISFDGVSLGPGDAWAPSATGPGRRATPCAELGNSTWMALRPLGNATARGSVTEAVHGGLGAGTYDVCYYIRGTAVLMPGTLYVQAGYGVTVPEGVLQSCSRPITPPPPIPQPDRIESQCLQPKPFREGEH